MYCLWEEANGGGRHVGMTRQQEMWVEPYARHPFQPLAYPHPLPCFSRTYAIQVSRRLLRQEADLLDQLDRIEVG